MTEQRNDGLDTKAKIIIAACEMFDEDMSSSLSVRAVASRAGVSMGSLRHHFPTQRALRDAVLDTIYNVVTPNSEIVHDTSLPARERLVQCLRQLLAPLVGEQARLAFVKLFEAFLVTEPTADERATYVRMTSEGQRRVEAWLAVLAKEGAISGDIATHAAFLNTVINGLSLEGALPAYYSVLERETATLYVAVDAVLSTRQRGLVEETPMPTE